MATTMLPTEIARRFTLCYVPPETDPEAKQAGELFAEVCGETLTIWHSGWQTGEKETTVTFEAAGYIRDFLSRIGTRLPQIMPDYRLTDVTFFSVGDSPALIQTIAGTLADGTRICIPQVQVFDLVDGLVTRINTYVDESQTGALAPAAAEVATAELGDAATLTPLAVSKDNDDVRLNGYAKA